MLIRAAMLAMTSLLLCLSGCAAAPESAAANMAEPAKSAFPDAILLKAADGVSVYARHYRVAEPKALILLFHQAGSSKDEYAGIQPRLAAAGYASLAIDQRSGGNQFGVNETVKALGSDAPYEAAQADMQAAVDWAEREWAAGSLASARRLPVIIWGSSYSSSLAFPLAAANKGSVDAVLAFSPDEYFSSKRLVRDAAAKLEVPVFITSSGAADEVAAAQAITDAVPRGRAVAHVPAKGVHGSSLLNPARNPEGAEAAWVAVMAFLADQTG